MAKAELIISAGAILVMQRAGQVRLEVHLSGSTPTIEGPPTMAEATQPYLCENSPAMLGVYKRGLQRMPIECSPPAHADGRIVFAFLRVNEH
jgi:hypothetical protein